MTDETNHPDLLEPIRHFLAGHRLAYREGDGVIAVAVPLASEDGAEPELLVARFRGGGRNRGITVRIASRRIALVGAVFALIVGAAAWAAALRG